jgi:replicative DNA helicase
MTYNELDLAVLKSIITNKKHGLDFVNEHDSKIFSSEVWNFANVVVGYIRTYKELPTLRVITEKLSKGNNDKLIETITNIWQQVEKIQVNDKEYKHDLEKLKKRFAEKQLLEAKASFSKFEPGSIDIGKAVMDMQKVVQSIRTLDHNKSYDSKNIKDHLPVFVDRFNAKKNNQTLDKGLMTKYSFFDYATNGLKPADFVVIAGETGFGKSLFLNNIAVQVWLQDNILLFPNASGTHKEELNFDMSNPAGGKNIIYFSLEMPYEDCFNRLLSRLSGVPSRKIENADLDKEEFNKIKKCLEFIKNYPYNFKIVDIADACANDLETILVDTGEDFDAIFIDYLGIMKTNEKNEEQDWLKQGIIAYETRAIARKYGKPIFSAVQLNRKSLGKESSENIGLNRLARSSTIATHTTHVIQIENRTGEEHHPDFLYHFIKNRKGPKGKGVLIKNLSCATLLDKNEGVPNVSDNSYDDFFTDQDDISEEMEDLEV